MVAVAQPAAPLASVAERPASLPTVRFARLSLDGLTDDAPFACALMLAAYLSMAVGEVTGTHGAAVLVCGTAWGALFSTAFLRREGVGQALVMLVAAAASLALACVGLTLL